MPGRPDVGGLVEDGRGRHHVLVGGDHESEEVSVDAQALRGRLGVLAVGAEGAGHRSELYVRLQAVIEHGLKKEQT